MATALVLSNLKELDQIKTLQISVTTPESKAEAELYLIKIDKLSKQIIADEKAINAPFKAEIERNTAAIKPYKDMLAERKQTFARAIILYNNKVAEEARIANAKALEKFEKKVDRIEQKAIEQGKPIPLVVPPALIQEPAKTVRTEAGTLTTVKRSNWRLPAKAGIDWCADPDKLSAQSSTDLELGIPLEYFVLDTARIGKIVRAGGTVPGIEIYKEESLSVRA